MVLGVMVKAVATVRSMVMFYKAVVHAVLIYRSEIWFIADSMMKVLEGFHNCIAWRIAGKTARHIGAVLWTIQEYVRKHQSTIEEYITTRLIYELYTGVERLQGTSCLVRWLDKYHIGWRDTMDSLERKWASYSDRV